MSETRRLRAVLSVASVLAVSLLAVGCTTSTPAGPSRTAAPTASAPSATPEAPPELVVGGTAEENLEFFDHVNLAVSTSGAANGRAFIDSLVTSGFDKAAMEVTSDSTPLNHTADTIQFSVRLGEECLIGQWGAGAYSSMVTTPVANGACLVGKTRTIDW